VPLDAENVEFGVLKRLGDLTGPRSDADVFAGTFDRLVMGTVHCEFRAVHLTDKTLFFSADRVRDVEIVSVSVLMGVFEMLYEASSKENIEDLMSSANAKDRFSGIEKFLDQFHLCRVSFFVNVYRTVEGFIIVFGIDIISAAEDQTVETFPLVRTVYRNGDSAAILDGLDIVSGIRICR